MLSRLESRNLDPFYCAANITHLYDPFCNEAFLAVYFICGAITLLRFEGLRQQLRQQDMVSACGPEFNLNAGCSLDVTGLLTKLGCSFAVESARIVLSARCWPQHLEQLVS